MKEARAGREQVKTANAPQPITIGEWRERVRYMEWSSYDRESNERFEKEFENAEGGTWREAYDNILLDMRAPEDAPDGLHPLLCTQGDEEGRTAGVLIKDGHFHAENIANACLEAVCHSYGITADDVRTGREQIDHVYIERFRWDPERRILQLTVGS